MEASISFIDTETNPELSASDAGQSPVVINESYVQEMIRAGIITHRFKPTEQFDAMFAASEIHELPEVSFVAAFKQGVIFLGCPDGPPECIADLVELIAPINREPLPSLSEKIDQIINKIEAFNVQTEQLDEESAVKQKMASRVSEMQEQKMRSMLSDLRSELDTSHQRLDELSAANLELHSQAKEALTASLDQSSETNLSLSQLIQDVNRLGEEATKRDAEIATVSKSLGEIHTKLNETRSLDYTEQLTVLVSESAQLKSMAATAAPEIEVVKVLLRKLEERLETVVEKENANAHASDKQNAFMDVISQKLDTLVQQTTDTKNHGTSGDLLSEALEKGFSGLRQELKLLKNQPKPMLDLTEQRQSFAAFTNVMSVHTKRLEAAVEEMGAHLAAQPKDSIDLLAHIEALPNKLREAVPVTDISPLMLGLDSVREFNQANQDRFAEIQIDLKSVADIAQSATVEVKRLSSLHSENPDPQLAFASHFHEIEERLGQLETQIKSLPESISEQSAGLINSIRLSATRPDLTEQRQSFARFGTALGSVVARLENAITKLSEPQTSSDLEEIRLVFQALPAVLHEAVVSTGKAEPHDIADIRDDIHRVLSELTALEMLKDMIQNLGQRPDPVPDFSEQRRGFARFSTAMGTIVDRLEKVADDLSHTRVETFDGAPIMQALEDIGTQLSALKELRVEQLAFLNSHLEHSGPEVREHLEEAIEIASKTSPDGNFSLDQTRFLLAERVALQIRKSYESV